MTHTATAAPAFHVGQHVAFDGRPGTIVHASGKPGAQILSVKTYAGTFMLGERHTKLKAMPAVGDRVEIDAEFMGEVIPLVVVVVQVDGVRIIGRPEGSLAAAFARTEWRAL